MLRLHGGRRSRSATRCAAGKAAARSRSRRAAQSIFPIHTLEIVQDGAGGRRDGRARRGARRAAPARDAAGRRRHLAGGALRRPRLHAPCRTTTAGGAASSRTPRRSTSPCGGDWWHVRPAAPRSTCSRCIDGSLAYIRNRGPAAPRRARSPTTTAQDDHLAFPGAARSTRPIAAIHRRMHELGIAALRRF